MRDVLARFRSRPPLVREAIKFGVALLLGVTLLPAAIYLIGVRVLGPYTSGGFLSFWGDFFVGLGTLALPWWLLALGPYALLLFARVVRRAFRAAPGV